MQGPGICPLVAFLVLLEGSGVPWKPVFRVDLGTGGDKCEAEWGACAILQRSPGRHPCVQTQRLPWPQGTHLHFFECDVKFVQ